MKKTCVFPTYPALAKVSFRYSGQRGRFPTCYSPVRHSLGIATKLVRLACIRHAASVYPEPGSNSQKIFNSICDSIINKYWFTFIIFRINVINVFNQVVSIQFSKIKFE